MGINNFMNRVLCKLLILDSALYFIPGLVLFFFPNYIGDHLLNRPTDGVHWHLLRCIGGQLMASSFLSCRSSNSDRCQPEVRTACLVLRLIFGILGSFFFIHTRAVNLVQVDPTLLRILIWFFLITAFLMFFLLIVTGWRIGDELCRENRWGNILYQIDTIAAVSIGLAWVIDPQWLLHRQVRVKLDFSHIFCGRLMGLMFISSQVISAHALHWRQHSDRAMAAETRAILCLFILSAQIWSQIAYGEHWSDKHWIGISLFSTWTGIAIIYRSYLWLSGSDKSMNEAELKLHSNNGHLMSSAKKAI